MLTLLTTLGACLQAQELRMVKKSFNDNPQRLSISEEPVRVINLASRQTRKLEGEHYTFATVLDGDTVPMYNLREVTCYSSGMLLTPKEIKSNSKLIRNVRLMLPYAREGKRRLDKHG